MRNWQAFAAVPCMAGLLMLAGCGDSTICEVSGKVTFDGQLIEDGVISFYPVDGKGTTAGDFIKKGAYSVKKVPVGLMTVKISMGKVVGMKKLYDKPDSPQYPMSEEALPAKYNDDSKLTLEVTPGRMQKDWELTSK